MKLTFALVTLVTLLSVSILPAQRVTMDTKPLTVAPNAAADNTVRITWRVQKPAGVLLQVVNAAGTLLRTLDAGVMAAGEYSVVFDGRDANGRALPAGDYAIRLWVTPTAKADLTFGAGGFLGRVTTRDTFQNTRKFDLGVKGIDPATVIVTVNGERWERQTALTEAGQTFTSTADGIVELNPAAEIAAGADLAISYPQGLPIENPWTLKTAPDGSLYIGENTYIVDQMRGIKKSRPGVIFKVDPSGKRVPAFGNNGALAFNVHDLDVDADGNLYALPYDHAITVFTSQGKPLYKVAGFSDPNGKGKDLPYRGGYWPRGIALNEARRMAIANMDRTNLLYDATKPDFSGFIALQTVAEGAEYPPVIFKYYSPCMAARGDAFYMTTAYNSLVKYGYNPETKSFSIIWRTPKLAAGNVKYTKPDQLWQAMGIALDGSGLIYVANRMNHRVQIYFDAGASYKHVGSIGSEGTAVAQCQLMAPHAVALSPDRKSIYIADDGIAIVNGNDPVVTGLGRVVKWTLAAEETIEAKLTVK